MKTSVLCAATTLMVACGLAHAQFNWIDRDYTANISWTGGDAMGSFTSGSSTGISEVGGTNANWNGLGVPFPSPDAFSGDSLFMYPEGGQITGGWASYYTRNPAPPVVGQLAGGLTPFPTLQYNTTSSSTRTFNVSGNGQFVFSIAQSCDFYLNVLSQGLAPYTLLSLEGGTYSGGVFTPGGLSVNLLTDPAAPVLPSLLPGTYRFSMAYERTWDANTSFSASNEAAWGVYYAVPAPGAACVFIVGGMFASRRRRC